MYAEQARQSTADDQNDQYVNFLVNLLLNILIDALLFIIYCGCLTIGFWYVSIFFGYLYFNYSLDVDRALICFVSFFVLATFMPRKRTLHTFVITLYVYSLLLPTLVWFAVGGATPLHLLVTAAAFFVLLFLHHIKIRRLVVIALPHSQVAVAITLFSFALGLWIVSINGLSMVNIHIYDVYKFRRGSSDSFPILVHYLWPQFANALLPLALTIFLHKRKYILFGITSIMCVGLFSVLHHKTILFIPLFVFVIYRVLLIGKSWLFFKMCFCGAAVLGVIEIATLSALGSDVIGPFNVLFIRRVLLVPAQLNGFYFEFFDENLKYYWSQSKITFGLLAMPYEQSSPKTIGAFYFGNKGTSSNTGFLGQGFANAGYLGVLIYLGIFGFVLAILEANARKMGTTFVIMASLLIVHNAITASDMITLMLTGGFLSLIIAFACMKGT